MESLAKQIQIAQKQGVEMIQAFMVQGATIQKRYEKIFSPTQQQWNNVVSRIDQQAMSDTTRLQAAAAAWSMGGK